MGAEECVGVNVKAAWRKFRWSLAHRGLGGTLRVAMGALHRRPEASEPEQVHPFDRLHGTDTGGLIGGGSLATGSRNDAYITAYAGVPPSRLRTALDHWQASLPDSERMEAFSFVDLGCGKGRAMLLASERPFYGVTGVELNPELAAVAERNVLVWQTANKSMAPLSVLRGDATDLQYPDGPNLVFIYNSFGVPVVRAVLDWLERHVRQTGARIDLLFQNEGPEMPMRTDGRLRLLWTAKLALEGEDADAELVASPEDVTSLYRWVG